MASCLPQVLRGVEAPTCDITFIARALGFGHCSARTITQRIAALIVQRGFPRPLPSMRNRRPGEAPGQTTDAVTTRSVWMRAAITAWLDKFMPPEAHALADDQARIAAAHDMDEAAKGLRLIRGGKEA